MGSIIAKGMDENMKKQQEFMLANGRLQMERQIQMQRLMQQRMMATKISQSRELFWWWLAFYGTAAVGMFVGAKKRKNNGMLAPLVPLSFIVGYLGDLAYGTKIERIRNGAEVIMLEQDDLLAMPCGPPTFATIENERLKQRDKDTFEHKHDLFL